MEAVQFGVLSSMSLFMATPMEQWNTGAANTVNNTVRTGLRCAGRPRMTCLCICWSFLHASSYHTESGPVWKSVWNALFKDQTDASEYHTCAEHHWAFRGLWETLPDHTVFLIPPIASFPLDVSHSYPLCFRRCPVTSKKNNFT